MCMTNTLTCDHDYYICLQLEVDLYNDTADQPMHLNFASGAEASTKT